MLECEANPVAAKEEQYLTVKEASELFGIAPNTLRSWGDAGKIVEYRQMPDIEDHIRPSQVRRGQQLWEVDGVGSIETAWSAMI